ncbi:MAG: formimidoylglutamate deiminase [Actinomycetota bacterium]|nr:formimidoylglutamate deiminase [Actinomycetota bacterium]
MITLPAFANCHSHAFHRALRGRVTGADSFWSWRDQMYALAGALDPDLMFDLAKATYGEMRLAGIGVVGEFHYLHHGPDGAYDDPNAMGEALIAAAREAGIRICLLDACYLSAGFPSTGSGQAAAPEGVQRRFSDGSAEAWAVRVGDLAARHAGADDVVIGAAIHSVRAVPQDQLSTVADALPGAPLHVHLSEQPAENEECLTATGLTPTALLAESGVWTSRTTAVHATHLTAGDIHTIGEAASFVCFCPTTERELADGIGPSVALRDAGARLTLGSDSNTVIDMFEEARAVEMNERLASGIRGSWSASELGEAATAAGYESLGFAAADKIQVSTDSVRMAGATESLWAATSADVIATMPDGRPGAEDLHQAVAQDLQRAIAACWSRV